MTANFTANAAELGLVSQIFQKADSQNLGILKGDAAVGVFGAAKLPPTTLGEIWSIADEENNGWLSRKGTAIALRLIGWAQSGEKITRELISKPGPLATLEGYSTVATHSTGMSSVRSLPLQTGLPPFTAQDKAKFQNLFLKAGPANGLLSGDKARDIFLRSKLPNDTLLQIWNLADTKDRGALDSTDFAIGMYFIQAAMSNQLTSVPQHLPPGLYTQAGGVPSYPSVAPHATGASGSFSPMQSSFPISRVQQHYTGQSQMLQPDHTGGFNSNVAFKPQAPQLPPRTNASQLGTSAFGSPSSIVSQSWDITPAEKAKSDTFFDTLDTLRRGYIEGDVAVPFMLESKLPQEVLAQIWDLSDISGDGRLNKDCFAVAYHLIQKQLAGGDLPATLPPSLVPPSMRTGNRSGSASFVQPQFTQPEEVKDLFSWDDSPPPSAVPLQANVPVSAQPTGTLPSRAAPPPPVRDPFGATPFAPPGLQTLPVVGPPSDAFTASGQDLLGDDEAATSPPLQDHSAEIGNVQNQLNSTSTSLDKVKNERTTAEQALADQAAQLSALQTQLSSAKAAYETETKVLASLRERFSAQTTEIQKTREELIRSESDLSAVRVEKAEVEGSFLRDKEEARDLHRKMMETSQEIETLKTAVEKAKKDAKQQKGLLAIARKQLATKEAEKAKVEKELAEAESEAVALGQERQEVEAKVEAIASTLLPVVLPERALSSDSVAFAASQALPASPDPASPAIGAPKSNNPFDRLHAPSGNSTPRSQSPFAPSANATHPPVNGISRDQDSYDPFGFSQFLETTTPTSQDTTPITENLQPDTTVSTPRSQPTALSIPDAPLPVTTTSPTTTNNTEDFITPPSTAQGRPDDAPAPKQTTLETAVAKFPELASLEPTSSPEPNLPGHFTEDEHEQTDLHLPLKEIEVEESDSESETEHDKSDHTEPPPSNLDPPVDSPQANGVTYTRDSTADFDTAFGMPLSTPPSTSPPVAEEKQAVAPFGLDVFDPAAPKSTATDSVAGATAFDEAFGSKPTSIPPSGPMTFETAFDDNFDFAAAGSTSPLQPVMANATPSFDDWAKGSGLEAEPKPNGNAPLAVASPLLALEPANQSQTLQQPTANNVSFDDVFASATVGTPTVAADSGASKPASSFPVAEPSSMKPFPSTASPTSVNSRSKVGTSPPRARSPPPRIGSPKPRASTSSKESHEKPKEPPVRHSKLSIRLPFGRKKKQQDPMPSAPSHLLTPPQEEPIPRSTTPASDGDVEAVKQITDMGFSRAQAVSALENHGYDVTRALNSLLEA